MTHLTWACLEAWWLNYCWGWSEGSLEDYSEQRIKLKLVQDFDDFSANCCKSILFHSWSWNSCSQKFKIEFVSTVYSTIGWSDKLLFARKWAHCFRAGLLKGPFRNITNLASHIRQIFYFFITETLKYWFYPKICEWCPLAWKTFAKTKIC